MHSLITIGGGAAGYFGSIRAAEAGVQDILILEKSAQVLTKVKISGGGRCNTTHHCLDPKALATHYPRGHKSLIGPFHRFHAQHTIDWFQERGITLHTESDGRMFPQSNDSQTIIDCLERAASEHQIKVHKSTSVTHIEAHPEHFTLTVKNHAGTHTLEARQLLIASGGTRLGASAELPPQLGHTLVPATPSLFTFKIDHPLLTDLPGITVDPAELTIPQVDKKLQSTGPLLITHWGVSGPATLKLSAWAARALAAVDYHFTLHINWLPEAANPTHTLNAQRQQHGKKHLHTHNPFAPIPKRLWQRFLELTDIPKDTTYAQLSKRQLQALDRALTHTELPVTGKSINKDEFVTAGGVPLKELVLKTLQSKHHPHLHFAGEVLDIDGITGGFNFQNAWTTAHLAAQSIAAQDLIAEDPATPH